MIAAKIGEMFKQMGNGADGSMAQRVHEFLRIHCAANGDEGGEVADDEVDEFTDEPGSVETLVCLHDS